MQYLLQKAVTHFLLTLHNHGSRSKWAPTVIPVLSLIFFINRQCIQGLEICYSLASYKCVRKSVANPILGIQYSGIDILEFLVETLIEHIDSANIASEDHFNLHITCYHICGNGSLESSIYLFHHHR